MGAAGFFAAACFGCALAAGADEAGALGDAVALGEADDAAPPPAAVEAGEEEDDGEAAAALAGPAAAAGRWAEVAGEAPLAVEQPQMTTAAPVIQTGSKRTRTVYLTHSADISL